MAKSDYGLDITTELASRVRADMLGLSIAVQLYGMDNSILPTTRQGLGALVTAPTKRPLPRHFRAGGYLDQILLDPWGKPYHYEYPGKHGEFDIWTLGADGAAGGEGENFDIGDWMFPPAP